MLKPWPPRPTPPRALPDSVPNAPTSTSSRFSSRATDRRCMSSATSPRTGVVPAVDLDPASHVPLADPQIERLQAQQPVVDGELGR